jgi:hypothetical protein
MGGAATAQQQDHAPQSLQQQLQACAQGKTTQDTQTCMTEARRAHAARKTGDLDTNQDTLSANAKQRCAVFTGEEQAACILRLQGYGSSSGSVAGGGILREIETVVVPPDSGPVRIEPRTADPLILVPEKR